MRSRIGRFVLHVDTGILEIGSLVFGGDIEYLSAQNKGQLLTNFLISVLSQQMASIH